MQTFKDLQVWQLSIKLTKQVYELTKNFPSDERFGLISQMRRCAISIPSNVAEGFARRGKKENAYFVNVAYGSALELETQLIISKELKFIESNIFEQILDLLTSVQKLLYKYRAYLQT